MPRVGSEECHCSKFHPSRRAAFCLLTMSSDPENQEFVLPSRSAVKVFFNDRGGISIVGEDPMDDPAIVYFETQDVPKIIAALRQAVKDAKGKEAR